MISVGYLKMEGSENASRLKMHGTEQCTFSNSDLNLNPLTFSLFFFFRADEIKLLILLWHD